MDPVGETRPLLRSFENETWRTRARRRCMRVPSEITVTGLILGLFVVVVTLLIVFQDMEAEKKEELTLDSKLLASPFKYNKKAEDKTWLDRKAEIIDTKKQKVENSKWDTVNKGWKKVPNLSASPGKYNKMDDAKTWLDRKKDIIDMKKQKLENYNWDNVNKLDNVKTWLDRKADIIDMKKQKIQNYKWDNVNRMDDAKTWLDRKKDIIDMKKQKIQNYKWDNVNRMDDAKTWLDRKKDIIDMKKQKLENYNWDNVNKLDNVKTWLDRKADIIEMKKQKIGNYKWDNVNKGWKKFPDISGKIYSDTDDNSPLLMQSSQSLIYPRDKTEYGKEIDDSLESLLDKRITDSSVIRQFNKDTAEMKSLLNSGINWKELDEGWKTLSEKGWKDWEIRRALFLALKEKRKELKNAEDVLQLSPLNLDDFWDKISDSWTENIQEGNKEIERQKKINDEWKEKMGVQQSPKASIKQYIKEDEGHQKLSDSGWKNKEIEEALIKAWNDKENVQQSPMNIPGLWGKATNLFNNLLHKGTSEEASQKAINDKWKNKFNILQSSSKTNYNKWKDADGYKKKNYDLKDKGSDKAENEDNGTQQPPLTLDILEKIIDAIMTHLKEKNSEKIGNGDGQPMQSPTNTEDFIDKIIEMIKDHQKDLKDQNSEEIGDGDNQTMQSPTNYKDFIEKIIEMIKEHHKELKDQNSEETGNADKQSMQSPTNAEDFIEKIIEMIKDQSKGNGEKEKQKDINDKWKNGMQPSHTTVKKDNKWKEINDHWKTLIEHERNTTFGKNDRDGTSKSTDRPDNGKWQKIDESWKKLTGQGWNDKDIREAVDKAYKDGDKLLKSAMGDNSWKWKKVNEGWKKISNKSIIAPTKCPFSKSHRALLLGSSMPALPIKCALIAEEVRREYGQCIDLSFLPQECKPSWREKCFSTYKYRKLDGTCNNKIHPTWGRSGTPFVRMIAPDYADGVSTIRAAVDGGPLPNARLLSGKLYSKQTKPDSDISVLFMYFGLLVDHDMIETEVNSNSIPCCDETFIDNPETRPKECLQIDIPSDDPFYGPKNVTCLGLTRSVPVTGECGGRREQLNKATHYLDGSVVYGSTNYHAKQLRTFSRGQLRTQRINNTPFMSYSEGAGYSCGTPEEPLKCFEAGDSRVNMLVELTAMHTLWYREHNRIATELLKLNPQWRDEIIYQETRRILTAELQHITYSEFLPILLGKKAMEDYELNIEESKNYEGYDDTVDPSVFNNFGAAAFRFGHSLVPDMQHLLGPNNSTLDQVPLHETFFNAETLYHKGIDFLVRGAANQRTHSSDSYITQEVREHLFQAPDSDHGSDLAAVGIQRGRDHGLPSYPKWRSACRLSEVKTWDDLYTIMDKDRADTLKALYKSVDDIDLIPGALAEHHAEGSIVGPTYTCLIGRQFKKTRKGDRFWFEIQNEIHSLTKDQLSEIYKSSIARLLCDNSDNIKEIQRYPMKVPSNDNVILDCDAIPKVDLSEWKSNI